MSNNVNNGNATNNANGEQPTAPANVPRPVPLYVPPHRRAGQATAPVPAAPGQDPQASVSDAAYYHPGPRYANAPQQPRWGSATHDPVARVSAAPYHAPFNKRQSAPQAAPQQQFAPPNFGASVSAGPYYASFTQRSYAPQAAPLPPPVVNANVPVASYHYVPTSRRQSFPEFAPQQAYAPEDHGASVTGAHGGYFTFAWPQSTVAVNIRMPDTSASAQDARATYTCWQPGCVDRFHEAETIKQHMWDAHGIHY